MRVSISFAILHRIEPARVGTEVDAEGVAGVGFARNRRVVLLDQDRVVGAVARRRARSPIRSRPAPRRSSGCREGIAPGASPGRPAGRVSAPIRCADMAPAPRCRAACRPCSRWCPRRRGAACRGSTRRAAPASRLCGTHQSAPGLPRCSARRCVHASITSAARP